MTIMAVNSIPVRIAAYQRGGIFDLFLSAGQIQEQDTVIYVGVTSGRTCGRWIARPARLLYQI